MADKTQNIFINYKFPMAEAEKASQTLNRINQTNNLVQQSAQKAGSAITQEFQKSNKTILDMQTALTRLRSLIEVTSNPTKLSQLTSEYKNLKTQLDAATKSAFGLDKAVKQQGASVGNLASQFGNLYQTAKLVFTGAIIREVVDLTLSMASLQGKTEGVEKGFNRAFPNATQLLNQLREATHGTVTDFELMQRTLQATNLGVDVKSLPKLFEFAAARAQQTGESVDYLVDSIVRGIGRKSLLVLDNLGISATRLREKLNGASLASQSVAKATQIVGEIAEEELTKMGGFADNAETQVNQLKTAFEQLRIELAKKLEAGGILESITEFFQDVTKLAKGHTKLVVEESKNAGVADAELVLESLKTFKGTEQEKTDFIQQEINKRVDIGNKYLVKVRELSAQIIKIQANEQKQFDEFGREIQTDDSPTVKRLKQELEAAKSAVILVNESRVTLKAFLDDLNKSGKSEFETIDKLQEKLKELKRQREEDTFTGNKSELDRLQREIILLEDRILKISDNIKWQQQWNHEKEQSALKTQQETDNLKTFSDELDKLSKKFANETISFSSGDFLPKDIKETIDTDAIEESLTEIAEQIPDSFWVRFRLAFKNKAEDSSNQLQQSINEAMDTLKLGSIDILADQLQSEAQLELQSLQGRLKALKNFYDEQQLLAGDNEKARQLLRLREERETTKLQRAIFEKEKQTRRSQALIDGAAGVVKAFATYPYPAALIISGLIAAQTLSQIRIINRQRPGFKKGVIDLQGPGTSTSDSIPANLSKHESVMTAWETQHAGDVLREIRAKKLDNKVLKDLKQGRAAIQQQFNDERIIKAIEKNRPPDVIEQSGIVYKVTKKSDTYLNKIRAKSVRI